jgi:hypothetical protein
MMELMMEVNIEEEQIQMAMNVDHDKELVHAKNIIKIIKFIIIYVLLVHFVVELLEYE